MCSKPTKKGLLALETSEEFDACFPILVQKLTTCPKFEDIRQTTNWLLTVLEYNVPRGKKSRGHMTVLAYEELTQKLGLSDDQDRQLAYVLGWCVEILQAFCLIMDDIVDGSVTRRGQPCWYQVKGVGLSAITDGILLQESVFILLKEFFGHKNYYVDLLNLFHEVNYMTALGQCLDTQVGTSRQIDTYTPELYASIVKYKTTFYSFQLPISLAMIMTDVKDQKLFTEADNLLMMMGYFFQVQDDFLDCFGLEGQTGKIGTDIQEAKCTWLLVQALTLANEEEKKILRENLGKKEAENLQHVRDMYDQLGLRKMYTKFEDEQYALISQKIQNLDANLPAELFQKILDNIHCRCA